MQSIGAAHSKGQNAIPNQAAPPKEPRLTMPSVSPGSGSPELNIVCMFKGEIDPVTVVLHSSWARTPETYYEAYLGEDK